MVDQTFFTQDELQELFGPLETTPDSRIFLRRNINLEHNQGPLFYVAAVHFDDRQKRSYFAADIKFSEAPAPQPDETTEAFDARIKEQQKAEMEATFKKMQEACDQVTETGKWPVPF